MKKIVFGILLTCLTFCVKAQNCGCTDPLATNYNAAATLNDGSCVYASATITPTEIGELDSLLSGTSSMIFWDGNYWSCNDHGDGQLFLVDSTSAQISATARINGMVFYDMEEIDQDEQYLYFGDFGNNAGTRHDLRILRISKTDVSSSAPVIDTIWFEYEDQTDFTYTPQATDFDCESFIVSNDSIYLFTKQWTSEASTYYSLSKEPGHHTAHRRETYNVGGLITGATFLPEKRLVVLCGYDYGDGDFLTALHPFIVLLYDFSGNNFFSGNKRRLNFPTLAKDQVEAVATSNALDYFITNEYFATTQLGITIERPAKMQKLDLSPYLAHYLYGDDTTAIADFSTKKTLRLFPNPATEYIQFDFAGECAGNTYTISNMEGKILRRSKVSSTRIDIGFLPAGSYIFSIRDKRQIFSAVFIKK